MNAKQLGDEPAYPLATIDGYSQYGLTKRERIAMAAMAAMLSNHAIVAWRTRAKLPMTPDWFTENAVLYADALLAELAKDTPCAP